MKNTTAPGRITITFRNHTITLSPDGTWEPSDPAVAAMARAAEVLSRPPLYEYSPAHGAYGPLLAHRVAEKLGGIVVLPAPNPDTKPDPDIVY